MAMNRQTRRHLQKQGEMSADGAPMPIVIDVLVLRVARLTPNVQGRVNS